MAARASNRSQKGRRRFRLGLFAAAFALAAGGALARDPTAPRAPAPSVDDAYLFTLFGDSMNGALSDYVSRVGERMARAAGREPNTCSFHVMNTDLVNAFATPSCTIFITRGLLAIMNSEDELAAVLGHEIGHVVADHSDARVRRATAASFGVMLASAFIGSPGVTYGAGQTAEIYTLRYSRDQETEADDHAVRTLRAAGYNPFAAAEVMHAFAAHDAVLSRTQARRAENAIPAWARTHPLSSERETRARSQAATQGAASPSPAADTRSYLRVVRGLTFGDDPNQGYVLGRTFAHPRLRVGFTAPEGFHLTNTPTIVLIDDGADLRAQFGGGPTPRGGVESYARGVLGRFVTGQSLAPIQRSVTNGLETVSVFARSTTQGRPIEVAVTAYRIGDQSFHFVTFTPEGAGEPFAAMLRSMRALSFEEAQALRPRQLDIVQVGPRDTAETLAARMAFDDSQLDWFLALNGREAGDELRAGDTVKLVRFAD